MVFEPDFLPAAKPSGHRMVRVVVVVGGGDYFEVMTLELTLSQGQLFFGRGHLHFFPPSCSPTLNFLRGGIQGSLTRFLFGVGSVT